MWSKRSTEITSAPDDISANVWGTIVSVKVPVCVMFWTRGETFAFDYLHMLPAVNECPCFWDVS